LLAGGLLLIAQIIRSYQDASAGFFRISSPGLLLQATGFFIVAIGIQIVAWSFIMRGLGSHLSWSKVIAGYSISFLPKYIPGGVWGYLSRSQWLKETFDVTYAVSNLGSLMEIILSVTTACLIMGVYVITLTDGVIRLALVVVVLVFPVAVWSVIKLSSRHSLVQRFIGEGSEKGTLLSATLTGWIAVTILYLLMWACVGASLLVLIGALDPSQPIDILAVTSAFSASWLAGFLVVFVPAGLGVRELVLAFMLQANVHILAGPAIAVSVMSRFAISISELAWVLIGIIVGWLRAR
jgi:hypothetical protein